jgi:hypothetical protein
MLTRMIVNYILVWAGSWPRHDGCAIGKSYILDGHNQIGATIQPVYYARPNCEAYASRYP